MGDMTLVGILQALVPAIAVGAPLLIKIGRVQQATVNAKEALDRIERSQDELLRREVFTSEIRGLEARLVRIEERLGRLEDRVFHAAPST